MNIRLDTYDFNRILACFWRNEEGQWEGAIQDNLHHNNTDAKIIISDKIILVIQHNFDSN